MSQQPWFKHGEPPNFDNSAMHEQSINYFRDESNERGLGARRIVAKAFAQSETTSNVATPDETAFHLNMATSRANYRLNK